MTTELKIEITEEMAQMIRAKVERGEYASESDVIYDSLLTLQAHERTLEEWLREQVLPAYDGHLLNPANAVPADEVRAALAAAYSSYSRAS